MNKFPFVFVVFLLISPLVFGQSSSVTKVANNTQKNNASFKNPRGFVIYLPENYDSSGDTKYPIIFWLHGLGKDGSGSLSDLNKLYNSQICNWLKTNDVPFLVFAPQDHNGYFSGAYPSRLTKFVQWTTEEYEQVIDFNQLHLAGLSAGGYGIREFIVENDDLYKDFATFTPMSTNLNNANDYAQRIIDNDQYVWIHQGTADTSPNAIGAVKNFHKAIQAIDPSRSRLTAYIGMGHSAWEEVYDNTGQSKNKLIGTVDGTEYYNWTSEEPNWYEWLLEHAKTSPPTFLELSNNFVEDSEPAGTVIGTLSGNGSYPKTVELVAGSGDTDNDSFTIENSELVIQEETDFVGKNTYSIRARISNSEGQVEEVFEITVEEINVAPSFSNDPGNQQIPEKSELTFSVPATDVNSNDILIYSLDNSSESKGMTIDIYNGDFSWTPPEAQDGNHVTTITVSDGEFSDEISVEIFVEEINEAPVIESLEDIEEDEINTIEFTVIATDSDVEVQELTYSIDSESTDLGMSIDSQNGQFSWATNEEQDGQYTVSITVTDGELSDMKSMNITVNEVNVAPVIEEIEDKSISINATLSFEIDISDEDNNETLTMELDDNSSERGMTLSTESNTFTWTPSMEEDLDEHEVTITVGDGVVFTKEHFIITVTEEVIAGIASSASVSVSLYPNPVNDTEQAVNIEINNEFVGALQYNLVDIAGRVLDKGAWNKVKFMEVKSLDISNYNRGVLVLNVSWKDHHQALRIIKQ